MCRQCAQSMVQTFLVALDEYRLPKGDNELRLLLTSGQPPPLLEQLLKPPGLDGGLCIKNMGDLGGVQAELLECRRTFVSSPHRDMSTTSLSWLSIPAATRVFCPNSLELHVFCARPSLVFSQLMRLTLSFPDDRQSFPSFTRFLRVFHAQNKCFSNFREKRLISNISSQILSKKAPLKTECSFDSCKGLIKHLLILGCLNDCCTTQKKKLNQSIPQQEIAMHLLTEVAASKLLACPL